MTASNLFDEMLVKETVATNIDRGDFETNDGNLDVDSNYGNCGSILKRPTLPKDRPTTFTDIMRFVADWFESKENARKNYRSTI